ncbi:extracellular solute-binding protein, partial [Anaerococcus sp. ENR1011]
IVDEKITMTMVAPGLGINEWNDMDFVKDYEEKTNVHMDITTPPQSEFKTKLNLDFASGDIPDVIYAGGPNTLNAAAEVDYGSQGLLAPLEDLIPEYAPNFNKLMEEDPEIKKSITTTDGHIYAIPHINEGPTSKWIMGPVWYNGEWLDNLGVKDLPKTTDEFYDLMVRFKNEDPNGNGEADEIPISDVNFGGIRHWFMPAFGLKGWGVQVND